MNLTDPAILRTVLESLRSGVYITDREKRILLWSDGAEHITGYLRHEIMGHLCQEVLAECGEEGEVLCHKHCPLKDAMQDGKPHDQRLYVRHKLGHRLSLTVRSVPIRDAHGLIIGAAKSFDTRQPTEDEEPRQNSLATFGCLDSGTGFPHHGLTQTRLRESLERFQEHHLPFGILCVAIDKLEDFRKQHSRDAGEAALRAVGRSIENALRPEDFLGRWSDEQFLVILANCPAMFVEKVAIRILGVSRRAAIQWWGDWLPIPACLGHAAVEAGDTMESLVARAQHSLASGGLLKAEAAASDGNDCTGE
jgi:diguanylate cyclase (GGDEF)-like protein/PAS domain S-box-containing protein